VKQITLTFAFAIATLFFVQSEQTRAVIRYEGYSGVLPGNRLAQPQPRPCVRENLRIKEGETDAAMGGVRATPYIFTNVTSSACTLNGYPIVELLNRRGAVVRRASKQKSNEPAATATVAPGETAEFNLYYNSGGAGYMGKPCPTYHKIKITAPGVAHPFVLRTDIQACVKTNFEVSSVSAGAPH
jgi:hypothetical protein